ncbi:MAG TPA: hypothetical protein VNU72_00485, partial [Puia sp.]|nr:hypothetical protein [Puia sp.]
MNRLYSLLVLLFATIAANAQTPAKDATAGQAAAAKTTPAQKPIASGYRIKYDHSALRIPGKKFAI